MKRLAILTLAFAMVVVLLTGFDTEWQPGPGDKTYLRWETQAGILYVDSTAKRDSSQVLTRFYGADSVRIVRKAVGAATTDADSLFLLAYTVDWYGTWALADTLLKGVSADNADGLDTVVWAGCRLSPGVAFLLKQVGTAKKPDSCQVIVSGVWTH